MKRNLFGRVSVFFGLCVPLCGCLDNSPRKDGPLPAATVTMGLDNFTPKTVTINCGATVQWNNRSAIWQTVTADPFVAKNVENVALPPGAEAFNSGKIEAGETYQHVFTVPGAYQYFSQPYELKGMVGQIIVKPFPAEP